MKRLTIALWLMWVGSIPFCKCDVHSVPLRTEAHMIFVPREICTIIAELQGDSESLVPEILLDDLHTNGQRADESLIRAVLAHAIDVLDTRSISTPTPDMISKMEVLLAYLQGLQEGTWCGNTDGTRACTFGCLQAKNRMCGDLFLDGNLTVSGVITACPSNPFVINGGQPGPLVIGTTNGTSLTFITNGNDQMVLDASGVTIESGTTLFVNEIDPTTGDTTCFSGNVSVVNGSTLFVNNINPVSIYDCTQADEMGSTFFSGNVVADQNVTIVGDLVVYGSFNGSMSGTGDVIIQPPHILFTNEIDPTTGNTTCFSGNVSVTNGKTLLVNSINPVSIYDCTQADDTGSTFFSGNVVADQNVTVVGSLNVYGSTFFNSVFIDTLLANTACIAGPVGIRGTLLVNQIDPIDPVYCSVANDNGTTSFSGNVVTTRILSTNTINAYNEVIISPPASTTALLITSGGEVIASGDLNIISGNAILPAANAYGTQGLVELGGSSTATNVVLYEIGTRNIFAGNGAVNASVSGTDNISIGTNANSTLTTANNTIALGTNAQALATDSAAIGNQAFASASRSIAIGSTDSRSTGAAPLAINTNAIAVGSANSAQAGAAAYGFASIAIGGSDGTFAGATSIGNRSIAIGLNATSSADLSIALGSASGTAGGAAPLASNTNAIAIGSASSNRAGATATGVSSLAIGSADSQGIFPGAMALGDRSIAIGINATANAALSVAIGSASGSGGGYAPLASNTNAIAIGNASANRSGPIASGISSVAIGSADSVAVFSGAVATGDRSVSIGVGTTATAANSIALGSASGTAGGGAAIASNMNAIAIGSGTGAITGAISSGIASIAFGSATATAPGALASGNRSVAIGNGASTAQDDAIVLGNSGDSAVRVGIGTAAPNSKLHIVGQSANPVLRLVDGDTAITSAPVWTNPAVSATAGTPIHYDGSNRLFGFTSSRRYKTNIRTIGDESEVLYQLTPVLYDAKEGFGTGQNISGFIAEDVYDIAPDLVIFNQDNQPENIAYNSFHAFIIREMQKLKHECESQSALIAAQDSIIASLLELIDPYRNCL